MNKVTANGVLALIGIAVPLGAEYATATPDHVPGTGFSVLLYEPFDFAYVLLVMVCFAAINIHYSLKYGASSFAGALSGIGFGVMWFCVAFLAVGQMHLALGGKL